MNPTDNHAPTTPPTLATSEMADSHQREDSSNKRRRRFVRTGVAAPIIVAMTTRSAFAWHCNTPSAQGSLNAVTTASMKTKHAEDKNNTPDETWTISNWINNQGRAGLGRPWRKAGKSADTTASNYFGKYKISELFSGLNIPIGLSGDDFVLDKLKSGNIFQKYMIVARLNYKFVPGIYGANVKKCLTGDDMSDSLNKMARGSFEIPPQTTWGPEEIISYLDINWIVKP